MNDDPRQRNYPSEAPQGTAITARLEGVWRRIAAAARRAHREPSMIKLVAVTKTWPADAVRAALAAGQTCFGENRVQEALVKIEELGSGPVWHLIGHLQRNKASSVVGKFALIHSVDSVRLIEALESSAAAANCVQEILLQINVSGEASKHGAPPRDLPLLLEALDRASHLRGLGLMTIPPLDAAPEAARPHFARLRELLERTEPAGNFEPRHLSMGMSGDFEIAIEEGATLVRVGSAIFGARDSANSL